MKSERIFKAIGNADDELLERYEERAGRQKKRNLRVRWGAIAACLCIAAAGVFGFSTRFGRTEIGTGQGGNKPVPGGTTEDYSGSPVSNQGGDSTGESAGQVYIAGGTVVSGYASHSSGSYAAPPANGTWFCFVEVKDALKEYAGKDVTYFLAVDIFENSKELNGEELAAELKRLSGLGYHVGYAEAWEYRGEGEKVPYPYAAGYFTAGELESFGASKDYGYAFHFAANGDGSPVSSGQGIVCDFDGGRH